LQLKLILYFNFVKNSNVLSSITKRGRLKVHLGPRVSFK
jgi:hypothetical protein